MTVVMMIFLLVAVFYSVTSVYAINKGCPSGKYGEGCTLSCSITCKKKSCNPNNGECLDGCTKGKRGKFCDRSCTDGVYGSNCLQNCSSNCLNNSICDKISGKCPHGCTAGYKGKRCVKKCESGQYGSNCRGNCSRNCKNSCKRVSGHCIGGCNTGWKGDKCDQGEQYIGCYRDPGNPNVMGEIVARNNSIQNDMCVSICKRMKKTFSGTQWYDQCFCSEDYRAKGEYKDGCFTACKGDNSQTCGGSYALSVHTVCDFGWYGVDGCNLNCPSNCLSSPHTVCRYESGECVYGCKPGMAGARCDCYSLDGDPRSDVGSFNINPNTNFKIFKTLTFPRQTKVTGVRYYAVRVGKVFVSFWRKDPDDSYNWLMVDKIELDPSSIGVQEFKMNDRFIEVNTGDAVGLHYPRYNWGGVIPCQTRLHGEISSWKDFFYTLQSGDTDINWEPDHQVRMHVQADLLIPALKIMYNCIEDCPSGSEEERCSFSDCPVSCYNDDCNRSSGACLKGCVRGKRGRFCNRDCTYGFYGKNCSKKCFPYCFDNDACNKTTGFCPRGCAAGYKGTRCGIKCESGKYGHECRQNCNPNCNNSCDHVSGHCIGGCKPGLEGDKCDKECNDYYYGDCTLYCSRQCRNGAACNRETGHCDGGCDPGYTGQDCRQRCGNNEYGYKCETCSVHCYSGCNKFSEYGDCNGGCNKGYKGSNCTQVCEDGKYGYKCDKICSKNCFNHCNKFSYFLECTDGCVEGYKGTSCDKECEEGHYGRNCDQSCSGNCKNNETCDKVSGQCSSGCETGWNGDKCDSRCPFMKYGDGCKLDCGKCYNNKSCHYQTGQCINCQPGYETKLCKEVCEDGKYGSNCNSTCSEHCLNHCDKFSSVHKCTGGCKEGYQGQSCDQECDKGQYGRNCNMSCSGHCKNNEPCDRFKGQCSNGCETGWNGVKCVSMVSEVGGGVNVSALIACLVVLIVIIVVILVIIRYRKRCLPRKKYNEVPVHYPNKPTAPNDEPLTGSAMAFPTNGTVELPSKPVVPVKPYSCSEGLYVNVTLDNKKPTSSSPTRIPVSELGAYIANQMKGKEPFKLEYNDIPLDKNDSWDYCGKPELRYKNRFKNIMPYDKNRVLLNVINDDPFSDYINASFIQDYRGRQTFIACHGPNKVTIPDFWRMIWEYNISVIVMVTNLVEEGKVKCDRYWPVQEDIQHAGICISTVNVEPYSEYEIRTFNLSKNGEQRPLRQYHYTGWPDHGVPPSAAGIRCIREKVKPQRKLGPILVHCSAGVGRTGTFISLDILLDQIDDEGAVDINACVKKLRSQRVNMVQTLDQYIFIYKALREATVVGKTGIVCSDFSISLQRLLRKQPNDKAPMEKQFQFLESIRPKFAKEEMDTALTEQNRKKNRDKNVIPSDRHVIIMSSSPNSYINAVFVPGYRSKKGFIATQVPFDGDESIWRLITDLKCGTAVLLESSKENHKWYPTKQQRLEVKSFIVENREETVKRNIKQQDLRVCLKTKEECTDYANIEQPGVSLRLFSPINWTRHAYSERNIEELAELYTEVLKCLQKFENKTVLVMCSNGARESGIYIASSYLFDMAKAEHTVDIFNVVKHIRTTRPQFIDSMTEYNFLHTIVASFLGGFEEYANFK